MSFDCLITNSEDGSKRFLLVLIDLHCSFTISLKLAPKTFLRSEMKTTVPFQRGVAFEQPGL